MKKIIALIVIILFTSGTTAQNIHKKKNMYKVWVTTMDSSKAIKGYLYRADEIGIELIKTPTLDTTTVILVKALDIREIKLRRKGKIGRATWIGAVSGVVTGAMIGLIDGDDESGFISFSKEEKAVGYSVPLGIIGTGLGAAIGSAKKKIVVNGNIQKYTDELMQLKSSSIQK